MSKEQAATNPEPESNGGGSGRGPRSPNFPAISLADALAKARTLYEKDRRAWVSLGTVLSHLGFSEKLSGSTARVMSALRQFGLIEQNDKLIRVSEAVVKLATLSDAAPERGKALRDCALKPQIYREIFNEYPDGLPSDGALKDFLILQKKFNPDSVDTFLRVFKASVEFAKVVPGAYTADVTEPVTPTPPAHHNPPPPSGATAPLAIPPMNWVLSVPRGVSAELRIFGNEVRPDDLRRLKAQIDFLVESLSDDQTN